MDKQLLKAYIRCIVEEEVTRILPTLLSEVLGEVVANAPKNAPKNQPKPLKEALSRANTKPRPGRAEMASLLGLTREDDTFIANTNSMRLPEGTPPNADPKVVEAITRDYSELMKAMGIT